MTDQERQHPLYPYFVGALQQAVMGKGKERHGANHASFYDQPMVTIGMMTGLRGPLFQVIKKAHEAVDCYERGVFNQEQFKEEIYGAMVYLASLILIMEHLSVSDK